MKISGVVKSAEEITGQEGCKAFEGKINGKSYTYLREMNYLAGRRIELVPYTGTYAYDYSEIKNSCLQSNWQADWLKDIREEKDPVDWSKVPVDAKMRINIIDNLYEKKYYEKKYFAKYDNGKVYTWYGGRTSWTTHGENDTSFWSPNQVELVEEQ